MYVACSTQCFARYPLDQAMRMIAEMEFNKIDVAIHEHGKHLKPSEIAADVGLAAQKLRIGPGLVPVAFSLEILAEDPTEWDRQFKAVCRLSRLCAVPIVSMRTSAIDTPLDGVVENLKGLVKVAGADGVILCVATVTGTHTEDPDKAIDLCKRVPGLGLTLDPSHYLVGPNQGRSYDHALPYVRHVHFRDTKRGLNNFQVRIGQGEIEYGRIISQLARQGYNRLLTVDVCDIPDSPFAVQPEVRKLKYLLESLI
jgi:sugar phosphate isomerase/epimerase